LVATAQLPKYVFDVSQTAGAASVQLSRKKASVPISPILVPILFIAGVCLVIIGVRAK
jgi:hypothetical protein